MGLFQRVMENLITFFYPLKTAIAENFLPDLFGSPITETESELFCRPARHAGIGILDPVKTAQSQFFKSKEATAHLIDAITNCSHLDLQNHEHAVRNAVKRKEEEKQMDRDESIGLINTFKISNKDPALYHEKIRFQMLGLAINYSYP